MDKYKKYFQVGAIVKPQGIRGETRVLPTTDDPGRFGLLDSVTVLKNGHREYAVQSARVQKNMVILKFEGVDDRDAAENLVGGTIWIPPEKALPLEDGEYFVRDLIGLVVYTDEGENLGELTEVLRTGANDVYAVSKPGEREILIPAIKKCILNVDMAERRMAVHLLEGLRE